MALGCRGRRIARGLALAVGITAPGCQWLPFQRIRPALFPRPSEPAVSGQVEPKAPSNESARSDDPESVHPLPPLPLRPVTDREALAETRPTPLLDAASARSTEVRRAVLDDLAEQDRVQPPKSAPSPDPVEEPKKSFAPDLTLVSHEVASPPTPPEPETKPEEDCPEDLWETGLTRLRDLAREQAKAGGVSAGQWDLRDRLLSSLARSAEAADPLSPWHIVLSAMAEPASLPEEEAAPALRIEAPPVVAEERLGVGALAFCHKVHGFGSIDPVDPRALKAGQRVLLYCELTGLHYQPAGEQFRSLLSSTVELLPAEGDRPVWSDSLGSAEDRCRHPRRDYFVSYRLRLPESLPPGPYRLRLKQIDALAGCSASQDLPFSILP
jgi:hypothetical protein